MRHAGQLVTEPWLHWRIEPVIASQTRDLVKTLGLDLSGRHITDLGPGNGASLNIFRSLGADTYFVERNPTLYAYCRSRGFHGRRGNFIDDRRPVTDVAYVRGSVGATTFQDAADLNGWLDSLAGYLIVSPWLPERPPEWFTSVLDERLERVEVLGYQTPLYPHTWVG